MTHDPKKAAAIAAVAAYITAEEAVLAGMAAEAAAETEAGGSTGEAPGPAFSVWGLAGRQQQMQMRNLMQMKALHRGGGLR